MVKQERQKDKWMASEDGWGTKSQLASGKGEGTEWSKLGAWD